VKTTRTVAGGDWTVPAGGSTVDNDNIITFPQCTGSSSVITHLGIGTTADSNSVGELVYVLSLTGSTLTVTSGIVPTIAAGNADVTEA
jgi:hypothetical protein